MDIYFNNNNYFKKDGKLQLFLHLKISKFIHLTQLYIMPLNALKE